MPSFNPVRSLMSDPEGKSTPIGTELAEKVKMRQEADKGLAPMPKPEPVKPVMPVAPAKVDLVHPGNKAPTGREAIEKMNKKYPELPKMHDGGTVPHTGPYVMKAGEHVLTPEKHGKLKAAMGLAMDALSQEPEEEKEPAKTIKEMRIRRSANGGHIVTHIHHHFMHPDEEHVTNGTDHLMNHVMEHMTDPDEGEEDAEAGNHGIESMQKAVGFKK